MKIILLTGKLSYEKVKEIADNVASKHHDLVLKVIALPIQVAAMMNETYLLKTLPSITQELQDADIIVVPGYTAGDMSIVAKTIGKPVIKGPKHAGDIPIFIEMLLKGLNFSPIKPADEKLTEYKLKGFNEVLSSLRNKSLSNYYFKVGETPISRYYPIIILELYFENINEITKFRKSIEYADVLSLGLQIGIDKSSSIEIIKELKKKFNKPIAIDTDDIDFAITIADQIDLINGIQGDHIDQIIKNRDKIKDKPVILICERMKPSELKEIIKSLNYNGINKLIVDPVLLPPMNGLVRSLERYAEIRRSIPDVPLLMGIGNVTELSDVDSTGLNALLAFMGSELGVEVYLTTEASPKTHGSTMELRRALDMAIVARELNKPPKDLGVDLLCLKDKKKPDYSLPREGSPIRARLEWKHKLDPRGYFKIAVDRESELIVVQHYKHGDMKPDLEIVGEKPFAILREIIERDLVSSADHYFYLGYELAKAEIALMLGKRYIQDTDLFTCR